jgi:cell division protein FtsA
VNALTLTPRLKPLSPRKGAVLSVLDVGGSKVVCLIARLLPMEQGATLRGRTHRCRVMGLGQQRSRGVKGGAIVDLDAAESAIRLAVDAAERMAGVEVESVVVNMSGGRLGSRVHSASLDIGGREVTDADAQRVLEAAAQAGDPSARAALHLIPMGYWLDAQRDVADPRGMIGEELGGRLGVSTCDVSAARNLMLAIERCHLRVAGMVASPYAAGLSTLVDDEAELGAALIDLGAGATTMAAFANGRLAHIDSLAVGGQHVTMDIARGLSVSLADAERLKTLYGACIAHSADERETISIHRVGDDLDRPTQIAKSELTRIIRPRVEEILELARDRLAGAGFASHAGRRLVLTGGASGLGGLAELARAIVSPQARMGRPLGVEGLPDAAKSPAFATSVGLMIYPQVAGLEHLGAKERAIRDEAPDDGYVARVRRWLKQSF